MSPLLAALGLLLLAGLIFWLGARQQKQAGLPNGRIIYSDSKTWGAPEKPYYDPLSGLTGKPDYVVQLAGRTLPVEVKSAFAPPEPYESHILQLMAYCLLIERASGQRPPYGILRYRNRTFAIDYTRQRESQLLDLLDEMRRIESRGKAARSHDEPARCARCGYARSCTEKL